jgi:hypothetical protein
MFCEVLACVKRTLKQQKQSENTPLKILAVNRRGVTSLFSLQEASQALLHMHTSNTSMAVRCERTLNQVCDNADLAREPYVAPARRAQCSSEELLVAVFHNEIASDVRQPIADQRGMRYVTYYAEVVLAASAHSRAGRCRRAATITILSSAQQNSLDCCRLLLVSDSSLL